MRPLSDQVLAQWKWLLSFRKADWEFADYPVRVRRQKIEPNSILQPPRFTAPAWVASIVGLWITGTGDSREKAIAELEKHFDAYILKRLEQGGAMIRPGTQAPVEFASTEQIRRHEDLAQDFIERILEHEWAFLPDESSLWDFHAEKNNDACISKIRHVYGVDVADIESGRIAPILDRIAAERIR